MLVAVEFCDSLYCEVKWVKN